MCDIKNTIIFLLNVHQKYVSHFCIFYVWFVAIGFWSKISSPLFVKVEIAQWQSTSLACQGLADQIQVEWYIFRFSFALDMWHKKYNHISLKCTSKIRITLLCDKQNSIKFLLHVDQKYVFITITMWRKKYNHNFLDVQKNYVFTPTMWRTKRLRKLF